MMTSSPLFHSTSCPRLNRNYVPSTVISPWRLGADYFFSIVVVTVVLAFVKRHCKRNFSHFGRYQRRRQQRLGGLVATRCYSKAAASSIANETAVAAYPRHNILADFTCAICLDCPATCEEVARISCCTHRFCFDCIDKWAKTENRCPCCKARFRTIERVVPFMEAEVNGMRSAPLAAEMKTSQNQGLPRTIRSGERERDNSVVSEAAVLSTTATAARVNSRTVEDRDQSVAQQASFAIIRQGQNEGDGVDIQIVQLTAGGEHPLLQFLEYILNDTSGNDDDAEAVGFTHVTEWASNGAVERGGNEARLVTTTNADFDAVIRAPSIAPFHIGSNDGRNRGGRTNRGASTRRRRATLSTRIPEVLTRQQALVSSDNGTITTQTSSNIHRNADATDTGSNIAISANNGQFCKDTFANSRGVGNSRSPDQSVVISE
mmetsp:Transcript_213/g.377  ORF Transcript_213/g.377 Transcript_213/m.377 type:complete len:433 (+) Transcript_213:62-1360(+)